MDDEEVLEADIQAAAEALYEALDNLVLDVYKRQVLTSVLHGISVTSTWTIPGLPMASKYF